MTISVDSLCLWFQDTFLPVFVPSKLGCQSLDKQHLCFTICIYIYILVGGLEHEFYFSRYWEFQWISSSQLTNSYFFRGLGIPPTSIYIHIILLSLSQLFEQIPVSEFKMNRLLVDSRAVEKWLLNLLSTCWWVFVGGHTTFVSQCNILIYYTILTTII